MHLSIFSLLAFVLGDLVGAAEKYNRSKLMEKYPHLGKNFVFFPDEKSHSLKVGYLDVLHSPRTLTDFFGSVNESVTFVLYNRRVPDGIKLTDYKDIPEEFDRKLKTIFVTHGWMSDGKQDTCISIKDAYLEVSDVNVIIMDWSPISGNIFYLVPMGKTEEVGNYYAKFLNFLIEDQQMDPKDFHLIGHSLGAHVSGAAGRGVKHGKVGRITGLDPALPGFNMESLQLSRLNKDDAEFVDVIHTCAGILGFEDPLGHADFYPNGGHPPQPGCILYELTEACSHGRSWQLFAESIILDQHYMASKCDSLMVLRTKQCRGNAVPMGDPTPRDVEGLFYLETTGESPFIKL